MLIICNKKQFANLVIECFCHNGEDEEENRQCPFYGACDCSKFLGIVDICKIQEDSDNANVSLL